MWEGAEGALGALYAKLGHKLNKQKKVFMTTDLPWLANSTHLALMHCDRSKLFSFSESLPVVSLSSSRNSSNTPNRIHSAG